MTGGGSVTTPLEICLTVPSGFDALTHYYHTTKKNMRVIKFGGTSVGTSDGLYRIKQIATRSNEPVVVVVSALAKVTDALFILHLTASKKEPCQNILEKLTRRHLTAIYESVKPENQQNCIATIKHILNKLKKTLATTPTNPEEIVSYGELLSSVIVQNIFDKATQVDSRQIIRTTPYFDRHIINFTATNHLINSIIKPTGITVMGGFISSDLNTNKTTNLGRGGSDYTAAVVAAALNASQLEIYTDVDGFLTADPRIVEKSTLITKIDYCETMELCNFGAKIVYAPTILPAYLKKIPTYICNTYNPNCKGTLIHTNSNADYSKPQSICAIAPVSLIKIKGRTTGLNYRIFKILSSIGIETFFERGDEATTYIAVAEKNCDSAIKTLVNELNEHMQSSRIESISFQKNLATVAIIGNNIGDSDKIQAKIFDALNNANITTNRKRISLGINSIAIVVPIEHTRLAVCAIHNAVFEAENTKKNTPNIPSDTQKIITAIETIDKMILAGDIISSIKAYLPSKSIEHTKLLTKHLNAKIINSPNNNQQWELEVKNGEAQFSYIANFSQTTYDINGSILIYSDRYREYPLHISL